MNADAQIRDAAQIESLRTPLTTPGLIAGSSVVLLRPRRLRGTIGIVRRPMASGWEVEIRSPEGTPLHLTLPEKALHLRS